MNRVRNGHGSHNFAYFEMQLPFPNLLNGRLSSGWNQSVLRLEKKGVHHIFFPGKEELGQSTPQCELPRVIWAVLSLEAGWPLQHFTLTVPLSTQVFKWVSVNLSWEDGGENQLPI